MKKLFPLLLFVTLINAAFAQDDAGSYITQMSNAETVMNKSYMTYISAAAHSSRKRKIEKLRDQAVQSIVDCQSAIGYMPAYKSDNSLKQNALSYVQLCYKIFNDDYAHIVNMEDIAERSYDEMQAYLLLQQATDDTLQVAIKRMTIAEKTFAAKYKVTLIDQQNELSEKMQQNNSLATYHNKVYLLFYKCNWEDGQLTEAVNEKNVTKIEQVRNALIKYANEGLAVIDTISSFDGDNALAYACKQSLMFYKQKATDQVPGIRDFYLKEENFEKLKTTMDAKAQDQRTQADVDNYNKAVNDINDAVNNFNQTNKDLDGDRTSTVNNWNDTEKSFIDKHTPYYKG
jgi:hypothetical protein